jgi:hypothetical protein
MTDLTFAAQDATFDTLNVAAVTDLAQVLQHVPENTQPPVVVIGDITVVPIGGKDGGLDELTIEIITMFRGPKRSGLLAIQHAVRSTLEGAELSAAGALLSPPVFESSDDEILEDGITYLGTQRFSTIAQPAD